jgi:methylase of polypeptide subunit release factors
MCVRKPLHIKRFSNTHSSEPIAPTHSRPGTLSERHTPSILFVANLPYVRDNDPHVSPDTAFEPPQALYGGKETGFETTARFLSEFEAFV